MYLGSDVKIAYPLYLEIVLYMSLAKTCVYEVPCKNNFWEVVQKIWNISQIFLQICGVPIMNFKILLFFFKITLFTFNLTSQEVNLEEKF